MKAIRKGHGARKSNFISFVKLLYHPRLAKENRRHHAGCEAGLASARLGLKTAILTISMDSVADMPCNPNIGGTGKGHLVREIDALGGEMAINIDKTFIQSRMLNTSKGPAVHSLRVQADKKMYHTEMKKVLENEKNIDLIQAYYQIFSIKYYPCFL